jgi:LuxR family maltose regulon positive regulatory protein
MRPRLGDRLSQGIQTKLTLISAPAGFGKTTLVSAWMSETGFPVAWYSLDPGDDDPIRFFTSIATALDTLIPGVSKAAIAPLQVPTMGNISEQIGIEAFLTVVVNEIAVKPEETILVLDDYHVINSDAIHRGITYFLNHMPRQSHLILTSRSDPPLPLSRLRARGQLTEIRQQDLRFTTQEALEFFHQTMGLNLTHESIAALEQRTEGWVAGLQLAALSLKGQDDFKAFIPDFGGSHRYVIDYLAEEVLRQQPEDLQSFMLQTAILDRLSAPLCNALTQRHDSKDLLHQLEQTNLFIIPLDEVRGWYRYHHIFADFLRQQAVDVHDISLPSYHLRASEWFENNGYVDEAVKHALASNDHDEAKRLISLVAYDTLARGEISTVSGWLDSLPEVVLRSDSNLATIKGWLLLISGQGSRAESYMLAARDTLSETASSMDRARLLALQGFIVRIHGEGEKGIALGKQALALIGERDPFLKGVVLINLGEAQHLSGDITGAVHSYSQVLQSRRKSYLDLASIAAIGDLASLLNLQGRRREAQELCEQTIQQCIDSRGHPTPLASVAYLSLGQIYYEANNLQLSEEMIRKGLKIGDKLSGTGLIRLGRVWLARIQGAFGAVESARRTIQNVKQIESQFPQDISYMWFVSAIEAEVNLRAGDIALVREWVESLDIPTLSFYHNFQEIQYLVAVQALFALDRIPDAQGLLSAFEANAREAGRYGSLVKIYVFKTMIADKQGDHKAAEDALRSAIQIAGSKGHKRPFIDGGGTIMTLLPRVREVDPQFVDELIDLTPLPEIIPKALKSKPIESLSERELEVLQLVANGLTNRQIAERLYVTVGTVKKHLNNIFGKLGVKNRIQAVSYGREIGWLE